MLDMTIHTHYGRGEPPPGDRHYDTRPDGTLVIAACCDPCWTSRIDSTRRRRTTRTTPRRPSK